ncbi:recombinase family protein [Marinococcus halotolerans]|uniref:recombinase family protein n=1 Tax=Marinococcus halotolerans TaxID=301092 RepID=UPI0003B53AC3|nr:recombinase family protein [Marinococcus halotolerans]
MEYRNYGYIRVSSKDQNESRQLASMREAGIVERDIFVDRASGKNFQRDQYQLLKRILRKGDVLYIHSLDRFGRNKEEILQEWNEITKTIQCDIVVLDMPLLNTKEQDDTMKTFIVDLVLQILSWMAEEERTRIRTRQREGIDAAQGQGVKFGRPETPVTEAFEVAYREWKAGEIKAVDAMRQLELSNSTFYRLVKRYEKTK